jgi:Domain of unknown function (DUF397)
MLTPEWRKSSYSTSSSNCVEVKGVWRKSTYSNSRSNCVEVHLGTPDAVAIRDSKNPIGGMLTVTPTAWSDFTGRIEDGDFQV